MWPLIAGMAKPITLSHQVRSGRWESMISANGGLPAHRYTPQVTQRWPRGSEPASGLAGNRTAERARHYPHASPTLSYTAPQHTPPLPPTGRALQPTAGTTTTTSFQSSDTYWQPRPRAHKPTSNPRNRKSPTTACHQAPYHPRPPQTRTRNTSERSPTPTAPPRPHRPPPPKDIYATLASTLAPMDAEQYYQSIRRDLPKDHATLQGWKQEKRNDNEWGTEEDPSWEDTWKGTKDAFLEAAAETYARPPGDTKHGLHALLAFRSLKHRHTITLHPLDHNPHRWTPEDDATAAITVQQSPGNPEEYHITWNDPAPHPPASPTLPDVFATISAELQEAKAPQQLDEEMPQAPSPPTTQENLRTEPLTLPITTMQLPRQHRTTPDRNGFQDLPRE